jgi:hypothetical protein
LCIAVIISSVSIPPSRRFKVAISSIFIFFYVAFFHVTSVIIFATCIAAIVCALISFLFEPSTPYKLQNAAEYIVNINSFSHLLQPSSYSKDLHNGLSIIWVKKGMSLWTPIALCFLDERSALVNGFLSYTIPRLGGLDGTWRKHRPEDG